MFSEFNTLSFMLAGFQGPPTAFWQNFLCPKVSKLVFYLSCFIAALNTPLKVLSNFKLVKMLDCSDYLRAGISILTSASDHGECPLISKTKTHYLTFFLPILQGNMCSSIYVYAISSMLLVSM